MTTSCTASIGTSAITHAATRSAAGYGIDCGAVRYRNTGGRQGALRLHPAGTEVTCIKCLAKAPAAELIEDEAPAEELTFMQRQRLAGKAR